MVSAACSEGESSAAAVALKRAMGLATQARKPSALLEHALTTCVWVQFSRVAEEWSTAANGVAQRQQSSVLLRASISHTCWGIMFVRGVRACVRNDGARRISTARVLQRRCQLLWVRPWRQRAAAARTSTSCLLRWRLCSAVAAAAAVVMVVGAAAARTDTSSC